MKYPRLTQKRLFELLSFNEKTGKFYWKISRGTRMAGSLAGHIHSEGYVYIAIDRKLHRQSRLVWLYLYGRWPHEHLDHINRDTGDDRPINLRDASRSQNLGNRKRNKNNKCGFKGVSPHGKKYRSYINKDGKRTNLGTFNTPQEAHDAYVAMSKILFGEFARAA